MNADVPERAPNRPWPNNLEFDRAARLLRIAFDDGEAFAIPFELLRVESPSAENKGHGGDQPPPKGKANVGVIEAQPVGRYAVRIIFDDGHDTGLYPWDLLYKLGRDKDALMQRYRETLAARALRDEA